MHLHFALNAAFKRLSHRFDLAQQRFQSSLIGSLYRLFRQMKPVLLPAWSREAHWYDSRPFDLPFETCCFERVKAREDVTNVKP